jgi:hypothetical protein
LILGGFVVGRFVFCVVVGLVFAVFSFGLLWEVHRKIFKEI